MLPNQLAIVAEQLDDQAFDWLAERVQAVRAPWGSEEFERLLPAATALIVRSYATVDQSLLDRAPNLKVIARAGVALDRFDLNACRAANVTVVHTPTANAQAVTELVFAYMLDATRYRAFIETPPETPEDWNDLRAELTSPRQLSDCTLGILGLGQIGKRVARAAHAFNIQTIYHDLADIPQSKREHAAPVSFDELLDRANILTIHVDNRPSNRHIINAEALANLDEHAIIINTSRGFVADPLALAAFLRDNPQAQAMLDVHDPEPIQPNDPLLNLDNACLSPHIGAATRTAHANMSKVVEDVYAVLKGATPTHPAF